MRYHLHLSATALFFLGASMAPAQWQPVGQAMFSSSLTNYNVLAIDADNAPGVAFSDVVNLGKATVMTYSGSSWEVLGNAGFSAGMVMDLAFAYNSAGVPYVAYRDFANGQKATVMKLNGLAWEPVGGVGLSAGGAQHLCLAFGPGDVPYLAYTDVAHGNNLTVKQYTGGAWTLVGTEGGSPITVSELALAFNSAGVPYVAYHGNSAGCRVERFMNGAWELVGSLAALYDARISALCIGSDDVPYIAYNDAGDDFQAKVMKMDGGDWVPVGASVSAGDEDPEPPSMAMDADGMLYVAYRDNDLVYRATVKRFMGGAWQAVGAAGFNANMSTYLTLAVDHGGVAHVGFSDATNSSFKATVMRYQDGTTATAERGPHAPSLQLVPNPATGRVALNGAPLGAVVSVFDATGNQVLAPTPAATGTTVETKALPDGIYLVKVETDGLVRTLRLVVAR